MANRIVLRGKPREESFIASEVLTPGELVEFGGSDDIQAHSTAGGNALKMFVRAQHENEGAGIDDDIASGDEATVVFGGSGDKINAIASAAITANDFVESDGAGRVQTHVPQADLGAGEDVNVEQIVGQAIEAASGAGERVEIILR